MDRPAASSPSPRLTRAAAEAVVPFLDLTRESHDLSDELTEAFREVVASGVYLLGPQTERIESELGQRLAVEHVVATGSGAQALQILLHAYGIGPGDEVVTTAATFYATAKAIQLVGAVPVFADIDPETYNLDPAQVGRCISPRTRAILAVDLYGCPAPMAELRAVADAKGLILLEDAAQSFGASLNGSPPGALADGGILSFYPTKNLAALGDAGALFTSDATVAERARSIRFLGSTRERDRFDTIGISARIDEIQAAMLLVKLRHLDDQLQARRRLAERYDRELPEPLVLTDARKSVVHGRHLYVVRCDKRDELQGHLAGQGIQTLIHYRHPLHLQEAFRSSAVALPVTERWANEVLSLPLSSYLREDEQTRVIEAVRGFHSGS